MVRRVFFSFHYKRDNWRANQVRNSWVTQDDHEERGFIDAADWEDLKKQGDGAIERWIDDQLVGTSVTAVLIGNETYGRRWVDYEIEESYNNSKGLVGIYVHQLKNRDEHQDLRGQNPLDKWYVERNGVKTYFSEIFETYDWVRDNGYKNMGDWVEEAAEIAGR